MAVYSVEELSSSLVREFLSRKGLCGTLAKLDEECPRTAQSISNRAVLSKAVHLERLLKRNRAREQPYRTMLEVLVAERLASSKGTSKQAPCARHPEPTHGPTSEPHVTDRPHNTPTAGNIASSLDCSNLQAAVGVASHSHTLGTVVGMEKTISSSGRGQVYQERGNPITTTTALSEVPPSLRTCPSLGELAAVTESHLPVGGFLQGTARKRSEGRPLNTSPAFSSRRPLPADLVFEDLEDLDLGMGMDSPVPTRLISAFPHGRSIDLKTAKALRELLFGSTRGASFNEEWKRQPFVFSDHPHLRYGLLQHKGGPCGVLACAQAHILKHLMSPDRHHGAPPSSPPRPSDEERRWALGEGLAEMLWRAGAERSAIVVLPSAPASAFFAGVAASGCSLEDATTERLVVYQFSTRDVLTAFLHSKLLAHPMGCVLFLVSAILSRGIESIKLHDLDSQEDRLIGQHGYCTQEIVNLLLIGRAVPHMFNGNIELGAGGAHKHLLKGVPGQSWVGMLSLFEHYGTCEVGSFLKTPKLPIWVISSESHFSVLFSTNYKHWRQADQLDLFYYDGLAKQEEEIHLTLETSSLSPEGKQAAAATAAADSLVPPLELCIKTRWSNVKLIDWNDTVPIL